MVDKKNSACISQHLLNNHDAIFIIGRETDNIPDDRMFYRANSDDLLKIPYVTGLLKANLKIGLLLIGNIINISLIFHYYVSFVSDGGLIVIDNYNQFKPYLDYIYIDGKIPKTYSTLGIYSTIYINDSENKIILRKEPGRDDIKFAIVMSTYHRPNGKSKAYVERSIRSLWQQTYQNYKLFLIGDKYENDQEFDYFRTLLPSDKIETVNLPTAFERENCNGVHNLWCVGGVTAINYGMDLAVSQGFTYYVHLDDDDYWNIFHLRNMAMGYEQFPESCFVVTFAIDDNLGILPSLSGLYYNNFDCQGARAFHSSFGFRMDIIPFRYRTLDLNEPNALMIPADADILNRIGSYCREKNYKNFGIPIISAFYQTRTGPLIDFLSDEHKSKEPLINEINKSRSDLICERLYGKPEHYHLLYDLRTLLGPSSKNYMEIPSSMSLSSSLILQHPYKTNVISINNEILEIDILFLNGDNNEMSFSLYSQFVNPGGYIVFDSIQDVNKFIENYEIIGTLPNFLRVYPENIKEYNVFIVRKL